MTGLAKQALGPVLDCAAPSGPPLPKPRWPQGGPAPRDSRATWAEACPLSWSTVVSDCGRACVGEPRHLPSAGHPRAASVQGAPQPHSSAQVHVLCTESVEPAPPLCLEVVGLTAALMRARRPCCFWKSPIGPSAGAVSGVSQRRGESQSWLCLGEALRKWAASTRWRKSTFAEKNLKISLYSFIFYLMNKNFNMRMLCLNTRRCVCFAICHSSRPGTQENPPCAFNTYDSVADVINAGVYF